MAWRQVIPTRPLARLTCRSRPFWIHGSPRPFAQSHGFLKLEEVKPSFNPSDEQIKVAELCATQNVIVSARPGSGKTATAEAIVATHPNKRVAVLTYSKQLQSETKKRLQPYSNSEVLTFHGMAGKLFNIIAFDDTALREQRRMVLDGKKLPRWSLAPFDIIILDEFQDCTSLLFWLVNSFIFANNQKKGGDPARIVVLGDERQCIHRYRGADPRYLSLAPELLSPVNPYPFAQIPLSESFRLSKETVQFINKAFLGGEPYITSSKAGRKPVVLRSSLFDNFDLARKLLPMIREYGPENTAILAPSLRRNLPIQNLTNRLSEYYDIPISVSINDEGHLDDRVLKGKMCVSTIHQFKGSERDLIILFGIDSSYFDFLGRNLPDDTCPNDIFVALTRAAKQLVLVHNDSRRLMSFVPVQALYKTADVINTTKKKTEIASPAMPGRPPAFGLSLPNAVGIWDLTRHIPDESLDEIIDKNLVIRKLSSPLPLEEHIAIPHIICSHYQRKLYERVDDINGLAVVAAFEHKLTGSFKRLALGTSIIQKPPPIFSQEYASWLCRQACTYEARASGYRSRSHQMKHHKFNWMKPHNLILANERLQQELGDSTANLKFEVHIGKNFDIEKQEVPLIGRADIVKYSSDPDGGDDKEVDCVWEVKFVSQFSKEHVIQACAYAYLLASPSGKVPRTIILFNVRDGEKWEIAPRNGLEGMRQVIESTLRLKYTYVEDMKHERFIDMCRKTIREVQRAGGPQE